jgi:PAS domain S-box-containing protein
VTKVNPTRAELIAQVAELRQQLEEKSKQQPAAPATRSRAREAARRVGPLGAPLETFFRKHDAVMLLMTGQGRLVDANEAALRFYGYSLDQIRSLSLGDINRLPPAELETVRRRALCKERTCFVAPHRLRSGEIRTVEVRTTPITAPGGPFLLSVIIDVTARTRADEALRESEGRFRSLIESSPEAIFVQSEERIRYANPAMAALLGASREEMTDREFLDFVAPEYHDVVRKRIRRQRETGRPAPLLELEWVRSDGSRVQVESTSTPIRFEQRDASLVYVRDATERHRAYDDLRHGAQLSHEVISGAAAGIVVYDRELRYVIWNPYMEALSGVAASDVLGKRSVDLFPYLREHGVDRLLEQALAGRTVRHDGIVFRNAVTGRSGRSTGTYAPHRNGNGDIIGVIASIQDITDLSHVEAALRQNEARYRSVVDNVGDGIGVVDAQQRFLFANPAADAIFAVPPGHLVGRRLSEFVTPVTLLHIQESARSHDDGASATYAVDIRRSDGSERTLMVTTTALPDAQGEAPQFCGIFRDITERSRAEAEMARLEAQLQQAQKMELVGRLAGGVAHDFNNMLSIILSNVELAMDQAESSHPMLADLKEIRSAAHRSAELTRQLLAFARKQTIAPRTLDLNETVGGMLKMLGRLIGEDIALVWQPAADLWPVRVDPSQIDQLLVNLCANARDAIADVGRVTIETHNRSLDADYCFRHPACAVGDYVELVLCDDGHGMDAQTLAHVFEPFFTTKRPGEGTGLGLATVYGIVAQNGGFIDVQSEPGRGTTFQVFLPRHEPRNAHKQTDVASDPPEPGHETILLVEDEPAFLKVARRILEKQGYKILSAATPGDAVRLARVHVGSIHLIVTDVVMPEMNGRDLAKRVLSLHPQTKRLFMSGHTTNVIASQGVVEEGVPFIQKPFSARAFAAKVREVLDGGPES